MLLSLSFCTNLQRCGCAEGVARFFGSNRMFPATVFGRRSFHTFSDPDLLKKAKRDKEQDLVRKFPKEEDIVGDILVDLLMMNG